MFGLSSHPGEGGDVVEAWGANAQPIPPSPRATTSYSPRPRPRSPPSIDEVLQKSVRGFREQWWTTPSKSADEDDARADEAEGSFGSNAGGDIPPETQVGSARLRVVCCSTKYDVLLTVGYSPHPFVRGCRLM